MSDIKITLQGDFYIGTTTCSNIWVIFFGRVLE